MADPARDRNDPGHTPGNVDSEPLGRSGLHALTGDGESTPPRRDHLGTVPDAEDLSQQEQSAGSERHLRAVPSLGHDNREAPSLYKKGSDFNSLRSLVTKKKLLFGLGLGGAVAGGITLLLFGFLNVFKLDHMMSNIDAKTFARLNGGLDNRSSKYVNTYMKLRLADIGDRPNLDKPNDPDNLILRSNRVDNNNPLFDWYRTMRASKFEQEVFERYGFKFTSVAFRENGQIKHRAGYIQNKDVPTKEFVNLTSEQMDDVLRGNVNELNGKLSKFVDVERFENDKEGRRAIKRVVNDNTHWSQVFKRRHVRKAIQNMTGVRDWRFFENTRNRTQEARLQMRNKILDKALPESTRSGMVARCLFGVDDCRFNRDPQYPGNKSGGSASTGNKVGAAEIGYGATDDEGRPVLDDEGRPILAKATYERDEISKQAAETAAKIAGKAGTVFVGFTGVLQFVNLVGTLEMLKFVHEGIGSLEKMVLVAKGAQAMGMYQTYGTARDQIRTGEVNSAEVNDFMQAVGNFAASEGYQKVINGNDKLPSGKDKYCTTEYQVELEKDLAKAEKEFAYLCPDKQVGSANRAASIQDNYEKSIGPVIGGIVRGYSAISSQPIIGSIIKGINKLFDALGQGVVAIAGLLGLGDDIAAIMTWTMAKTAAFLGAGPMLGEQEASGVFANTVIQGGAYTAESTARATGASLTTPTSAALAKSNLARFQTEENLEMSSFERYFALSNPQSALSLSAFAASQLDLSSATSTFTDLGNIFKSFASYSASPFTRNAVAAGEDGYRAAEFAGIPTYDFPAECYNLDPITASPKAGTNIQQVLADKNIPDSELTWELMTNNDEWYRFLYAKIGEDTKNADEIAEKVYNCHLLDTSIRGSLGYLYGYTKDNGLEDSSTTATTPQTASTIEGLESPPNLGPPLGQNYYKMPVAPNGEYIFNGGTPIEQRCGSKELIDVIYTVAKVWGQKYPQNKLIVGDLNASGHASHKNGIDVDIYTQGLLAADTSGSQDASKELGRLFGDSGIIHLIFYNDTAVQNDFNSYVSGKGLPGTMIYEDNHENHFHVRISERYQLNSIESCP